MTKRSFLGVGLFAVASIFLGVSFLAAGPLGVSASDNNHPDNLSGLQKQFETLAKAWSKHDKRAVDAASKPFELSDPDGWFGKYFAKEQVPQLVAAYKADLDEFKEITPGMLDLLAKGQKYTVKISMPIASGGKSEPHPDAIAPLTPVPVEWFTVALIAENGMSVSMLKTFVYVDGSFRYVGGDNPVWVTPKNEKK